MKFLLKKLIFFSNNFNLLVAAGVTTTVLFINELFQGDLSPLKASMLGIAAWVVYALDHLIDAQIMTTKEVSPRHYAHFKAKKIILFLAIVLGIGVLVAAFLVLTYRELYFSFGIAAFSVLHLLVVKIKYFKYLHSKGYKEIFISVVFTAACVGLPYLHAPDNVHFLAALVLFFWSIVYLNLIQFARYDAAADLENNIQSIVTIKGIAFAQKLSTWLIALAFIGLALLNKFCSPFQIFVLCFMLLTLLAIVVFPIFFSKNQRYRFWGDVIFLYPCVYFLWKSLCTI